MEKYGFIYLWYDRKHKRFYIGAHFGNINDGYICSSSWMKKAYKYRPKDFKRRILKTNIFTKKEMFEEENRYLVMIKPEELGKKYYNLQKHWMHWSSNEEKRLTIGQKMSLKVREYYKNNQELLNSEEYKKLKSDRMKKVWQRSDFREKQKTKPKRIGFTHSTESKLIMSKKAKGKIPWNKGLLGIPKPVRSEKHRNNMSLSKKGKPLSETHRQSLKDAWVLRKLKI